MMEFGYCGSDEDGNDSTNVASNDAAKSTTHGCPVCLVVTEYVTISLNDKKILRATCTSEFLYIIELYI
jgi:hypothetical protein